MTEHNSLVDINIVVLNGEKYIRHCLDSVIKQTFDHKRVSINILDNGSRDGTKDIMREYLPRLNDFHHVEFIQSSQNLGMWGGHEELWKQTTAPYIVTLSADVILDARFVENAVVAIEKNSAIGAVQAKIYEFDVEKLSAGHQLKHEIIDTCGFKIFRSRRIVNIGHGEIDQGQFSAVKDIFGVEGAVPVMRRKALESIRISGEISDHDLFWYAEDLDVAWRLRLAGWEASYEPTVIAWHDRQTTKRLRNGGLASFRAIRNKIPLHKRRLEWRNVRFTIIKNDYIINIFKDLPRIVIREVVMTFYLLLFEPAVLGEITNLIKLMPRMIRKRKEIMKRAKISAVQIHSYFS